VLTFDVLPAGGVHNNFPPNFLTNMLTYFVTNLLPRNFSPSSGQDNCTRRALPPTISAAAYQHGYLRPHFLISLLFNFIVRVLRALLIGRVCGNYTEKVNALAFDRKCELFLKLSIESFQVHISILE
jgi:hypothetical protein